MARGSCGARARSRRRWWLLGALLLWSCAGHVLERGGASRRGLQPEPASAATPAPAARLALVIGNSSYPQGALPNAAKDASDMAATLRELGFTVALQLDADRAAMQRALEAFRRQIKAAPGMHLFYYAGHGLQVEGQNYLIPIGARVEAQDDVEFETISVDDVLTRMDVGGRNFKLVFLDACRDNPFPRFARSSGGLAKVDAPRGTLISYATAPGRTASDGKPGENGLYTGALLNHLDDEGLTVEQVLKRTGAEVERLTEGRQTPWLATDYWGEDVYLRGPKEEALARDLLQLARANSLRGDHLASMRDAAQALLAQREPLGESERAEAEQLIEHAGEALSTLALDVVPTLASAWVDGSITRSRAGELTLNPGAHTIELAHPGYVAVERSFELAPGEHAELKLRLRKRREVLPWVLGAAGTAALTVALATGIRSGVLERRLEERCDARRRCDGFDPAHTNQRGRALAITHDVTLSLGLAAVASAVLVRFGPGWLSKIVRERRVDASLRCRDGGCSAEASAPFDLAMGTWGRRP